MSLQTVEMHFEKCTLFFLNALTTFCFNKNYIMTIVLQNKHGYECKFPVDVTQRSSCIVAS